MRKIFIFIIALYSCSDKTVDKNVSTSQTSKQLDSLVIQKEPTAKFSFRDTVVTIYFTNKSLTVNPPDIIRLKKLADICNSDSLGFLKVVGFTDTTGNEKANDILSEKRANKIYSLLDHNNKINKELVYIAWLGDSEDAYDLHFHPIHPQQNCVDIWLQIKNANR